MILYRSRLIWGIIKRLFGAVFGVLYKIISVFNLQLTLLLLLVGLVLYATGVFENNQTFLLIYQLVLISSVVYALITTVRKLLGLNKDKKEKVKRSKGVQMVSEEIQQTQQEQQPQVVAMPAQSAVETPTYYRVKQNPEYVMAEYMDRYELFKIVDGKLKKVRTDYK